MPHPLVDQLHFTRQEWLRGLEGVTEADATCHFGPMNCISWIVGHMAWHEQLTWVHRGQGRILFPELNEIYAFGAPMVTPAFGPTIEMWHKIISAAGLFLDDLTTETLQSELQQDGQPTGYLVGSSLRRVTYHYWFHNGEIQAIRQMLGHKNLGDFVGDIDTQAPYRPE